MNNGRHRPAGRRAFGAAVPAGAGAIETSAVTDFAGVSDSICALEAGVASAPVGCEGRLETELLH